MVRKLFHILILLVICIGLSSASERCKLIDPASKDQRNFECTGITPYCCDNETMDARCCQKK